MHLGMGENYGELLKKSSEILVKKDPEKFLADKIFFLET